MKKLVLAVAVVAVALLSGCRATEHSVRKQFYGTQWQQNKHIALGRVRVNMGMSNQAAAAFGGLVWGIIPALMISTHMANKSKYNNSVEQFTANTIEFVDRYGNEAGIKISRSNGKGNPAEYIWIKDFFAYNPNIPYVIDAALTVDYNHRSEMRRNGLVVSYQWDLYNKDAVKIVSILTEKERKVSHVAIESPEYMSVVAQLQQENIEQLCAVLSQLDTLNNGSKLTLKAWQIL